MRDFRNVPERAGTATRDPPTARTPRPQRGSVGWAPEPTTAPGSVGWATGFHDRTAYGRVMDWAQRRQRAVEVHQAALRQRAATEGERATRLVRDFARTAAERGLPAVSLLARSYGGRTRYRTGLRGWYLKPDRSLGVSVDGDFYILSVAGGLRARLTGVRLRPETPPLQIGEGARDGESIPLADLLARVVAGHDGR